MEELFNEKGLRLTSFRKSVYEIFEKYNVAINTALIEDELESFDRITLYRTIKLFKEKGIIHEILFPNKEKKLALCKEKCKHDDELHQHEHVHFRCKACEEIYCVDLPKRPHIDLGGFIIEQLEIQAIGTCANCA
jgi:Fur family ferric uptake transcriptional regulator